MVFDAHSRAVYAHLLLIFALMAGALYFLMASEARLMPALMIFALLFVAGRVIHLTGRTNREIARFLNALEYRDFTQQYAGPKGVARFDELGGALMRLAEQYRAERVVHERERLKLGVMLDHVPVPLILVSRARDEVHLVNLAARRFFAHEALGRLSDLRQFGAGVEAALTTLEPGARRLLTLQVQGRSVTALIRGAVCHIEGREQTLISLSDIRRELEDTELMAWHRLVRVLTHEIMNSIAPVTSLAETAVARLESVSAGEAGALDEAKAAIDAVARRSRGLIAFVESYRQFDQLPAPRLERFSLQTQFLALKALLQADWNVVGAGLEIEVQPADLTLRADPQQFEQLVLNLLMNARDAVDGQPAPFIRLSARRLDGGPVEIMVSDNGPGIPPDLADKIFIPFFTTKSDGSGVGLAFARQVTLAHGGHIEAVPRPGGGTCLRVQFPA